MANGQQTGWLDPLEQTIWGSTATSVTGALGGLKSAASSGVSGALLGFGIGGLGGALAGGVLGVSLDILVKKIKVTIDLWEKLNRATRQLVDTYARYNAGLARLQSKWEQLDRRVNQAWANTYEPLLKKLTGYGLEFTRAWESIKIRTYRILEPLMSFLTDILGMGARLITWLEKFVQGLEIAFSVLRLFGMLSYYTSPLGMAIEAGKGVTGWMETLSPWERVTMGAAGMGIAPGFGMMQIGQGLWGLGSEGATGWLENLVNNEALWQRLESGWFGRVWKEIRDALKGLVNALKPAIKTGPATGGLYMPYWLSASQGFTSQDFNFNFNVRNAGGMEDALRAAFAEIRHHVQYREAEAVISSFKIRAPGTY